MSIEQKQGTITVTKMYKDGQLVVADTSKETPLNIGLFQTTPATISVQATHTKNLGNYQSLKIGVIVSVPTYLEELDDAHDFAVNKVSEYLTAELKALDGDNVDPVEVTETPAVQEAPVAQEEPVAEPKKRTRKKKEPVVDEEDHIPTFDTAPTPGSVESPTSTVQATVQVSEQPAKATETVVEEQEVSATMLRGMDYDALVGIVEANGLDINTGAYQTGEEGRKALAEDIIKLAFPAEVETPKDSVDATDVLTNGEPVEEPVPATPVEEAPVETAKEVPVTFTTNPPQEGTITVDTATGEPVAQETVEENDETPYTFEELSDYTDEELHQVYEYWGLGAFPEKRSMAIKRILEVQEKGL